jgi:hypothetical protein
MSVSYPAEGAVFNLSTVHNASMLSPYESTLANRCYFPRTASKEYRPPFDVAVSPIVFTQGATVDALVLRMMRNYVSTDGNPNGIVVRAFLFEQNPTNKLKPLTLLTPNVLTQRILPRDVQFDGQTPNPYYSTYAAQQWAITLPFSAVTLEPNKVYFVGAGAWELPGQAQGGNLPVLEVSFGNGLGPFPDAGIHPNDVQYYTTPVAWYLDIVNYELSNGNVGSTQITSPLPYVNDTMVGTALKVGVRTAN